jgi:carbamoyltransferase
VVLNTSFNNNVEPIVDSADDALACFLTTGLHYLVVGHYLVSKKAGSANDLLFLSASLPDHARLVQTRSLGANSEWALSYALANTFSADSQPISEIAHRLLVRSDKRSVAEVLRDREPEADWDAVATEFLQLWEKREIILRPRT